MASQPLDSPVYRRRFKDGRPKERVAYSYLCNPRVCGEHALAYPHCYCGVALEAKALEIWEGRGHSWRTLTCFWCLAETNGLDPTDMAAVHRWLARDLTKPGGPDPQMPGERGR